MMHHVGSGVNCREDRLAVDEQLDGGLLLREEAERNLRENRVVGQSRREVSDRPTDTD